MVAARVKSTWCGRASPYYAAALVALLVGACAGEVPPAEVPPDPSPFLTAQVSGTTHRLQAVSIVSRDVVWASGVGGTYTRTTDGGETWTASVMPGEDSLEFRDVHAFSADLAYLMASGPGELSRIYKTEDGGGSWTLQFLNQEPKGFYDCLDFWDEQRGIAYGDAVGGELRVLVTDDGGEHWNQVSGENLPTALEGEGGFAASGTCVSVAGDSLAWIGTGAAAPARVLRTSDGGQSWSVAESPLVAGGPAGIMSLVFFDNLEGLVLGGDLSAPDSFTNNVAATSDGGVTWRLVGRPTFSGAVYGAALVPGTLLPTVVAVGPAGASFSVDGGHSWRLLDTLDYWAVAFVAPDLGWAVGPEGRITKMAIY